MLTKHQLESYDAEISRLQAEGRVITVAGVQDVADMLDEIRKLRLKVEQLSETVTALREDLHDYGVIADWVKAEAMKCACN